MEKQGINFYAFLLCIILVRKADNEIIILFRKKLGNPQSNSSTLTTPKKGKQKNAALEKFCFIIYSSAGPTVS